MTNETSGLLKRKQSSDHGCSWQKFSQQICASVVGVLFVAAMMSAMGFFAHDAALETLRATLQAEKETALRAASEEKQAALIAASREKQAALQSASEEKEAVLELLRVAQDVALKATEKTTHKPILSMDAFDSQSWVKEREDIAHCSKWLEDNEGSFHSFNSQYQQDFILYNALFKNKRFPGTYIDLAAADPRQISNTWFFDQCLRWNGICIDADNERWGPLKKARNCRVVETCVDKEVSELEFVGHGVLAGLKGHNKLKDEGEVRKMTCLPLKTILSDNGVQHIDYVSLDIEGHELKALEGIDFNEVQIDAFTVEGNVPGPVELLQSKGYVRAGHLNEDILMVHESTTYSQDFKNWYASLTKEQKETDFQCVNDEHCVCNCHGRFEAPGFDNEL